MQATGLNPEAIRGLMEACYDRSCCVIWLHQKGALKIQVQDKGGEGCALETSRCLRDQETTQTAGVMCTDPQQAGQSPENPGIISSDLLRYN